MSKLSPTQESVLAKMQDEEWHDAFQLKCSVSTLWCLKKKGYLESKLTAYFLRDAHYDVAFRLKQKEE
jgi:hypothetical protein